MTQSKFNKKQEFENLILFAKSKELPFTYILQEIKRKRWNLNLKQAEEISKAYNINMVKILFEAEDINILNVDSKTRKALSLQRKNKSDYDN